MIGGLNIGLPTKGLFYTGGTNAIPLPAGTAYIIPPGKWVVDGGPYTFVQFFDPITLLWRTCAQQTPDDSTLVVSDGANVRIANLTGCAVGAVITNAGTGLTNGIGGTVTATPSAGGSVWRVIVGGAVNTVVTLPTFKGANYTYPPAVIVSPPPPGGIPCTAKAVIAAGALTSITITNQGAGYSTAPTFIFVSDPKDPNNPSNVALFGAIPTNPINPILSATATLTGSGTVTALVVTDPGNPLTATPTFVFSPASTIAATALMNYTVTSFTVVAAGVAYGVGNFELQTMADISLATPIYTNPAIEKGVTQPRHGRIVAAFSGGGITTTGAVVQDGGIGIQVSGGVMGVIQAGTTIATTLAQATAIVGGTDDSFVLMPMDS